MTERLFLRLSEDAVHGPESKVPPGTLRAYPVQAALREHVAQLLFCREEIPEGLEMLERVLPDGAVRIAINFGHAPTVGHGPGLRVEAIGATAAPALVRLRGAIDGVSVTLRHGAARALLGVPASAISGGAVPLEDLWRGDAVEMLERMEGEPDDSARAQVLQELLLRRLRSARSSGTEEALRAVRCIEVHGGRHRLGDVAAWVGVGERRLQQLFQSCVGLSPRTWSRLVRLHASVRALRTRASPNWAELAVSAGFYDQSHLVNEFRALSGLTPSEFVRIRSSGSSKTAA